MAAVAIESRGGQSGGKAALLVSLQGEAAAAETEQKYLIIRQIQALAVCADEALQSCARTVEHCQERIALGLLALWHARR